MLAIVMAADLDVVAVFAAMEYATVPFPVPLAPEVMVIQGVPFVTDQAQPVWVVTATLPVPPAAAMELLVGEIEKVHGVL